MSVPGPPSIYESLRDWNAAWDAHFAVSSCANDMTGVEEWLDLVRVESNTALWTRNGYLPKLGLLRDQVVRVQCALTDLACGVCSYDDFDARWTASPSEDCILRGLAAACDAIGTNIWDFCPEARLPELLAGGLLRLVHALADPPLPDPCFLPNVAFDDGVLLMGASPPEQAEWLQVRLCRTAFLSVVALETLRAWCRVSADPERTPRAGDLRQLQEHGFVTEYTPLAELEAMCFACHRADPARVLAVCARCQKFGRRIRYCDRRCQAADWPTHKTFCKHPVFEVSSALRIFGGSSRAAPSFKRPPALVYQLRKLRENDWESSYVVMTGRADVLLRLPDDDGMMMLFGAAWGQAISEGDAENVHLVFTCLREHLTKTPVAGVTVEMVRRQLEREFRCILAEG
ncbi:hypothetical protein AURDEDRAFT_153498 [Auricularia subglabra TFB-10046 SS5]|nr:hypothetical protein AURDEDRAFT_153498 [Auricularia subglabra TFB-10046 SS5]